MVVLLSFSQVTAARKSVERGVSNQNQFTRELPQYEYDSLAYKNALKQKKSSKGGKAVKSKKKKCKGGKSKGKSKKSKGNCNDYWDSSLEEGEYETTNERPWAPVSHVYSEYPSPSPHYMYDEHPEPTPYPVEESSQGSPVAWTPSAPYWYYSPSSPIATAAWDWPTSGAQEEPSSPPIEPTDSPTKDPTAITTSSATTAPTGSPTAKPTDEPTDSPTPAPVEQSEPQPVQITIVVPTVSPSEAPQVKPVEMTIVVPTVSPEAPQVKPVEMTIAVPTIAPSKGPGPTFAPYEIIGSEASPSSPSTWWSPVWFPSEFTSTTSSWKTEPIQSAGETGTMSTCENTPLDPTVVQVLDFTYEMFLTFGTNNPAVVVDKIEKILHHELASRLLVCDFDDSSQTNLDDFIFTTVVSLPKDTLTNNACSGKITMFGTECYSIAGRFTISVIESSQSLEDLIDGMATVMEELMHGTESHRRELQQSPLLRADASIEGLFFTGFATEDEAAGASKSEGSDESPSSTTASKTVVSAVSLAAAAVIVLLGGLLVFRRRKLNREYLDVSSDNNSRIGIRARGDSISFDFKPTGNGHEITDDASEFSLSVYTNSGNSASEDMTPLPDVSGADMAPIGITPKRGTSEMTACIPIVSPELAKTQEIARLPDESSVFPELAKTREIARLPDDSSISIAQSSISIASQDVNPFGNTVDV
jgi:hypothetical protein